VSEEIKAKPMKPTPVKESKESTPKALKERNETIYKPPIMSKALVPVEPQTSAETLDRMNSIKAQIEAFHKLKNECLEDLEDGLDEMESQLDEEGERVLQLPEDSEERTNEAVELIQQNTEDEILDEEGNPMWQQFVRTDYMQIDVPENPKLKAIMGKDKEQYQKIQKEWKKI